MSKALSYIVSFYFYFTLQYSQTDVAMKLLLLFHLTCTINCLVLTGENTASAKAQMKSQRRRNYCYRNPSVRVVQDLYPFQVGLVHLLTSVYQSISASQLSCHPILLAFTSENFYSNSVEWNKPTTESILDIIGNLGEGFFNQPILMLRLSLNFSESSSFRLQLRSIFLNTRRSESCYFFIIFALPQKNGNEEQHELIPVRVKTLFQDVVGDRAWVTSSYFLVVNLYSASILNSGQWATYRNKLELVCVLSRRNPNDNQNENPGAIRLILQTFCSSCITKREKQSPVLIQSMNPINQRKLLLNAQLFPNFMPQGFLLHIVKRALRYRTPESLVRIQALMDQVTPIRLLYRELKKSFHFDKGSDTFAWLNGFQKPGQRDFVEELELGGPFSIGLQFTPLYSIGYERIAFTFPYTEQRLALLAKKQTPLSKWQIIFEEVQDTILPVVISTVVVTSIIIAAFKRRPPPENRRGDQAETSSYWFLLHDWLIYMNEIFFCQGMFPASWKIPRCLGTIILLVNMSGTLYTGLIRIHIATDLTTEEKAKDIQSILQLNPTFVKDGLLWTGGRFESNDELTRLLPFQNARAAEAEKTSINLQYFYEPPSCVRQILTKERYVCVAFEEYMQLVMPSLPVDTRRALYLKSVTDLGVSDWVTIAHNRDFPWANELTMWTLALVESGIFEFWIRNMSLNIPKSGNDGDDENEASLDANEDVDSHQAQQEGMERLGENFGRAVGILVLGFFLELLAFSLRKYELRSTRLWKFLLSTVPIMDRFYTRIRAKLGRGTRAITHVEFLPWMR